MARPRDRARANCLDTALVRFNNTKRALPGVADVDARQCLVEQMLESLRRVNYVSVIKRRPLSARRADPNDELFDPIRAAILHQESGNIDEAFWLVFLFVHFGKHARGGWRYVSEVYGSLGHEGLWTWARTSADPAAFRAWLDGHMAEIKRPGAPGGFGNHRKYQSLEAYSPNGTGAAVETYVEWVEPQRGHIALFREHCEAAGGDGRQAIDALYRSMDAVASFGRTARFDYLAMVGKLGLAPIEPGSACIKDSTGPAAGARLLFNGDATQGSASTAELDEWLQELDGDLNVGMQVLEDALCNWQKSPRRFRPFRS